MSAWDPILKEMQRVLVPGGKILIVDMAAAPLRLHEVPGFLKCKTQQMFFQFRHPHFKQAIRALVEDPRWSAMLKHNPIRRAHEYQRYLESRFPGTRVETINLGYTTRILAFDSGPLGERAAPSHT